jgi:hypothetical protein
MERKIQQIDRFTFGYAQDDHPLVSTPANSIHQAFSRGACMADDPRNLQLRKRQIAGLLLLAVVVLIAAVARAHWGDLFPRGWWRW